MESQRISVIMPSLNQAHFIEQAITSVLSQDYLAVELIIVDGGSTDGTLEILRRYQSDARVLCISEPDGGQADALNKGLRLATGEILAWQNADDVYLPGAFRCAASGLAADRSVDLVFGNVKIINEANAEVGELRFVPFARWSLFAEGTMLSNQALFWRYSLTTRVGPFNPHLHFCMDYEFYLRASLVGRFRHCRQFLGAFRVHSASKTSTISSIGSQEHRQVFDEFAPSILRTPVRPVVTAASAVRRATHYARQGELAYLFRGFRKRLRVGQRSL